MDLVILVTRFFQPVLSLQLEDRVILLLLDIILLRNLLNFFGYLILLCRLPARVLILMLDELLRGSDRDPVLVLVLDAYLVDVY